MTDGTRAGRASRAALATVIPLRAPEHSARPSLRVVPVGLRRRRTAVATILAMAVMFSVMLGLAAFQTVIAQGQARLDRLDTDVHNAQDAYQKLRFDVAQLEAPARIVATARDEAAKHERQGSGCDPDWPVDPGLGGEEKGGTNS